LNYYLKGLLLSIFIAVLRLFTGYIHLRGPEIDYIYSKEKPIGKKVLVFILMILIIFGIFLLGTFIHGKIEYFNSQ